ncbi:MAG: hypothetical protein KDB02_10660 [Acidimicrobiales bacterium]|nr:hypothetical protein [Acidimicrobiales bacterium]
MTATGRRSPEGTSARTSSKLDPDELAALEDQREFLLRSLEDLEKEHDAGDLDDADYETLRDDYTARAAEVLRSIEAQHDLMEEARRPRNWGRTLVVVGAVVAFAVLAGVLVAASLGRRGEGDTASGGISANRSPSQRALECQTKYGPAQIEPALKCFTAVLKDDPKNAVALTWFAWLTDLAVSENPNSEQARFVMAQSERMLDEAIRYNPNYSYARALRAVVAFRHGDFEGAKKYLAEFEANDPSQDARAIINQFDLKNRIEEGLAESKQPSPTTTTTTPN